MNRTRLKFLAVSALLTLAGAVQSDAVQDKTLQEIAGYREWTRVNEKPLLVDNSRAALGG